MNNKFFMFAFLLFGCLVYPYPYKMVRLIRQTEDGKIDRTVDVIFDVHREIVQKSKKVNRRNKKFLKKSEQHMFTPSERTLLSTLRKLNTLDRKTSLLWEWATYLIPVKKYLLSYSGKTMADEFLEENKKNNLLFIDCDRARRIDDWNELSHLVIENESLKERPINDIYLHTDFLRKGFIELFNSIPAINSDKKKLREYCSNICSRFKNFYVEKDPKGKSKSMSVKEFLSTKEMNCPFKKVWRKLDFDLMSYELLFKLFQQQQKNSVVYAGGLHSETLCRWLTKDFKFKKVIEIGVQEDRPKFLERPLLSSTAWQFLLENPTSSLQRYKKNGECCYRKVLDKKFNETVETSFKNFAKDPLALKKRIPLLVKMGQKNHVDIVNARFVNGYTLLHIASKNGWKNIVEYLLKHGALTNNQDCFGKNALDYTENKSIIEVLEQHGATKKRGVSPKASTTEDINKLRLAVLQQDKKGVKRSLHYGTNPNILPHILCEAMGNLNILKLLYKFGATNLNKTDSRGETPLYMASLFEKQKSIDWLLEQGADPNLGKKPIFQAVRDGNRGIAKSLIRAGARLNDLEDGVTLLDIGLYNNDIPMLDVLLLNGAKTLTSVSLPKQK